MKKFSLRPRAAFSLVEVTLALGVAAFCLVSVFGLIPVGVNTNTASFEQTGAANVASAVAADLRATDLRPFLQTGPPASLPTALYAIPIPGSPSGAVTSFTTLYVRQDGTLSGSVDADATPAQSPHYRVTLYFKKTGSAPAPGANSPGNLNATSVRILITWPALADATARTAPSKFAGSFESFTGLGVNN